MKKLIKINSLILILILMLNILFPVISIAAGENVTITFEDANLYNAIVETLGDKIASSDATTKTVTITQDNIETITKLELKSKEIEDISGIEKFTNLTYLDLYNNKISNIDPLKSLTNLTTLYLRTNSISDITPVSNLTNLTRLSLWDNNISGITPISELTSLTELYLQQNSISDITPVSNLTNLTELSLSNNSISDITPVSNLTNLTRLSLWDNNISNITPVSNLTNLTELYLQKNSISDITPVSNLTNLNILYLWQNNISNITPLKNLTSLTELVIGNNNISDITPISNLTNLTELYLYKNAISDITPIQTLSGLNKLEVSNNHITDLSIVDQIATLELVNANPGYTSNYQTIKMLVTEEEAGNAIDLPQIFVQARDSNSKMYTSEPLELVGCTLSSDEKKITINEDAYEATVTIKGGVIADSTFTVIVDDGAAPVLDVKYSTTEPTNQNVTVTVTSNEKVQEVEGWNLSEDKLTLTKEYTQNKEEELKVYDLAGNETKTNIEVNNIDTTTPEVEVQYSTTEPTNQNVTVTVTANEEIQEVEGWSLSADKLTLTKTYTQNKEEELKVYDLAGNERKIPINISNIDTTAPQIEVEYNPTELTKGTVTVTITANEKVQTVEGWTLSEDKLTLTKIYSQKAEENLTIYDLAGNAANATISVNNIDITVPQAEVEYSTTEPTNKNVTVTITSNEGLQQLEGWTLSTDKLTLTREYSQNTEETVTIYDLAGNEIKVPIKINNIDITAPQAEIKYSTTDITKDTVKVTVKVNEKVQTIQGWTLEEDGVTLTKVYTQNKKEDVILYDLAGNARKITISITNIDTTAPELEVKYSTTKTTNENVEVTITTNEEIQEVQGWTLSKDKKTLTKTYSQNQEEEITIYDLAGNERKVTIKVSNIDKNNDANNSGNNNAGNQDDSTAKNPIPQTGGSIIVIIAIIGIACIGIVEYAKFKKYKDIK